MKTVDICLNPTVSFDFYLPNVFRCLLCLQRDLLYRMCRCFLSLFVLSCLFSETFKEKVSSHAIAKNHIQWFASIFPYPDLGSIVKCKSDSRAVISKNHFIIRFPKLFSYFAMIVTIVVLLENPHFRYSAPLKNGTYAGPKVLATLLAVVISASFWQTSAQLLGANGWADNVVTIRKAIGKRKRFFIITYLLWHIIRTNSVSLFRNCKFQFLESFFVYIGQDEKILQFLA